MVITCTARTGKIVFQVPANGGKNGLWRPIRYKPFKVCLKKEFNRTVFERKLKLKNFHKINENLHCWERRPGGAGYLHEPEPEMKIYKKIQK